MTDQLRRALLKGAACIGATASLWPQMAMGQSTGNPPSAALRRHWARLANYATFGANEETLQQISSAGWEAWVDAQLNLPPTPLFPTATLTTDKPTEAQLYSAWWTNALAAPDQLHQRVAFALSQWFVISTRHPFLDGRTWTVIDFYDLLLRGVQGSFFDLLYQVSLHPAMCAYLSSLYNQKGDPALGTIPDENYAREVMQLFTCGAEKRKRNGHFRLDGQGLRIPNYTEQDVKELARVFTGMGVAEAKGWGKETGNWLRPVIEYPEYHDYGSKTIMGTEIPAGLSLQDDVRAALEIITKYEHSVAGNFSRFMIQRLTVSNPKYTYVRDVSIAFMESNGDLKTMVRAILLHPDAVDGRSDPRSETGRLKEPLLWYASARRALAPPRDGALTPITGPAFNNSELNTGGTFAEQSPVGALSVFSFFPREHQSEAIRGEGTAHIDYVYPEAYLYNWNSVVRVSNKLWGNVIKKDADVPRFRAFLEAGASDEEFADFVLDQLLFGNHRPALREEVIALLGTRGASKVTAKVRDALVLALNAPDFLVNNTYQEGGQ